ncbi:MAG: APC family permease [Pseudomonadota bacterium]|jgi:amino acid transporter|nr:APC family permease [Pseudomonadota bacterium]
MAGPAKLRRDAGLIGLLYASLGSIIGSGWLFGALHAATQAGPRSVWSWIIGAVSILFLAFVFAELATMFPNSGALVHMTHVSHGDFVGKIWTWILFLAFVSVPPVEVSAVLTYANNYLPGLIYPHSGLMTGRGISIAAFLLAVTVGLNFLAVRWVIAINSVATWWKVIIPIATIGILMAYSFHPHNMVSHVHSTPVSGVFTAVATAGIIFSFFGFQQAIALAGETRNPSRYVPIALIISVVIGMLIYVGLQVSFITALRPEDMRAGWGHLHFTGMFGPLAAIAVTVGAVWWAVLLYVDALISPLGTAFIYIAASPRIIMAAGEMGNAPQQVTNLNRHGVPWVGLVVTYFVGVMFFFPFPSWQKLVSAVSLITVLSYSIGPVILLRLRTALPDAPRPFRLKAAGVLAPIAFIASNWIIYWTGYAVAKWMFSAVFAYIIAYLLWFLVIRRRPVSELGWQQAWWTIPYLGGMWLVSDLGPSGVMGGRGVIGFFTGMWIIAGFSLVILWIALRSGQSSIEAQRCAERVKTLGSSGVDSRALAQDMEPAP